MGLLKGIETWREEGCGEEHRAKRVYGKQHREDCAGEPGAGWTRLGVQAG